MVFSSITFLFLFLPVLIGTYYFCPRCLRNSILLVASVLFYAWGGPNHALILIASIFLNWGFGLMIGRTAGRLRRLCLFAGITVNLLVLCYFKYIGFIADNINTVLLASGAAGIHAPSPALPLGISFFTFHAISYIADIYRRQAIPLKNPFNMGLYISLFPQMVAGPIIRYHDIADQIRQRTNTLHRFASGCERFIFGIGKKVLIANTLGQTADLIFGMPHTSLTASVAWLGLLCYGLQIYFDFSGYSDMAVGLGRMFGFEFPENFNYPYIAQSVREFWRRWHLTLSVWFRDYLYIPLGGNRVSPWRNQINLFAVFFLCGLWHGATWNFAIWGCLHGGLMMLERGRFGRRLDASPRLVRHIYTLLAVSVTWVFFRAETLSDAVGYLAALFNLHGSQTSVIYSELLPARAIPFLLGGLLLSTPLFSFMARDHGSRRYPLQATNGAASTSQPPKLFSPSALVVTRWLACALILFYAAVFLSAATYNPFIYFRF